MDDTTTPSVMTPDEAAAYLRVTTAAVIAEADAGRLPGRRIGAEWRFSRAVVAAWITAPAAPPEVSDRDYLLGLAGCWAGDSTAEAMVEDIYRRRKRDRVGGGRKRKTGANSEAGAG